MIQPYLKKRFLVVVALLLCLFNPGIAQSSDVERLEAALSQQPNDVSMQCNLCVAYASAEMVDSTLNCIRDVRSRQTTPAIDARLLLAESSIHFLYSDYEKATAGYENAIQLVIANEVSDSLAFAAFNEVAEFLKYGVYCQKGLALVDQYLERARRVKDKKETIHALMLKVIFAECVDPALEVTTWLDSAQKLGASSEALTGFFQEWQGHRHYYFARYPKALNHYLLTENEWIASGEFEEASLINIYIADAYAEMGNFQKSAQHLLRGLPYVQKHDRKQLAMLLNSIGWSLYRSSELDSALLYCQRSKEAFQQLSPGNPEIAYPLGNLGLVYRQLGQLDSAMINSQQAARLFYELNEYGGVAEALNNVGMVLTEKGVEDAALAHFQKALKLSHEYGHDFDEMNAHWGLYLVQKVGNPSVALSHLEKYLALSSKLEARDDAIMAQQLEEEILERRAQEAMADLQLKSELTSAELERDRLRMLVLAIGFIVAIIIALITTSYWLNKRAFIKKLDRANKNNERIIQMISHDFRSPINNISLMLEIMQKGDLTREEFDVMARDLYQQSSEVSLMFDSFVGWATSQSAGYKPFTEELNWNALVNASIEFMSAQAAMKGLEIINESSTDMQIVTDRMAISLILRNILSNAIKFSDRGGKIHVSSEQKNGSIVTLVEDEGMGMTAEKLRKVLSSGDGSLLGTNKETGTGIGLQLAMAYAKSLGGDISATSQPSRGTTFRVSIPQHQKA